MGLFEIVVIVIVALLVVGPERMPEAVRSVALTIGRIKRFFNHARQEIEKQVGADDIRQQLHNEAVMEQLANTDESVTVTKKEKDEHRILGDQSPPF
jgi:sec-independent protein translocase protein TatB